MNNRKASRKAFFIFAVVWLVLLIIFTSIFLFNIKVEQWVPIAVCSLLISVTLLFCTGGFYYVDAEVAGNVLYIKHYNLFPVGRKFRMFQVQISHLKKVNVKKYFGGVFCFVRIDENLRGRIAHYPAIGFSAMSPVQRVAFIQFLKSQTMPAD